MFSKFNTLQELTSAAVSGTALISSDSLGLG